MTVRVSKPAFNLREKITELDKPTGIKGSELLKSNTIQEARDIIGAGRKNLIINGNFDFWQRGTSFSSINSMRYTADRWLQYAAGSSTITATQQPFDVGQTEVPGNPKYYYRMDNTPDPNTAWMELFYRIEDVTRFSGVPVTLSFWMRANKPQIGEDEIRLIQNFGTSGLGASSAVTLRGPLFDIGTSWKKYEFTFDLPSITGKTIRENNFLQIHLVRITNAVAADTHYDLAQFQLEYGRTATPFEQRSLGEELALCQRYAYRLGGLGKQYQCVATGFIGHNGSTDTGKVIVHLPTTMRTNPSISVIGTNAFWVHTGGAETGTSDMDAEFGAPWNSASSGNQVWLDFARTGGGSPNRGVACVVYTKSNNQGELLFDAELPSTYSP